MDRNHDGVITRQEFAAMMAPTPAVYAAPAAEPAQYALPAQYAAPAQYAPAQYAAPQYAPVPQGDFFDVVDTNHDGKITRDEFARMSGQFA